jgi:hypothetical protein
MEMSLFHYSDYYYETAFGAWREGKRLFLRPTLGTYTTRDYHVSVSNGKWKILIVLKSQSRDSGISGSGFNPCCRIIYLGTENLNFKQIFVEFVQILSMITNYFLVRITHSQYIYFYNTINKSQNCMHNFIQSNFLRSPLIWARKLTPGIETTIKSSMPPRNGPWGEGMGFKMAVFPNPYAPWFRFGNLMN